MQIENKLNLFFPQKEIGTGGSPSYVIFATLFHNYFGRIKCAWHPAIVTIKKQEELASCTIFVVKKILGPNKDNNFPTSGLKTLLPINLTQFHKALSVKTYVLCVQGRNSKKILGCSNILGPTIYKHNWWRIQDVTNVVVTGELD